MNKANGVQLGCGVNFINTSMATVFIPDWMAEYLDTQHGDTVTMVSTHFEKCTFICLKPENCDFYNVQNYKDVLLESLPHYSVVMLNQWIYIFMNGKPFWFQIV